MEQRTATEIAKELGYVLAEPGLVDPLRYPAHVLYRLADPKEGGIVIWQPAAARVLELVKKGLDAQFCEEQAKQTPSPKEVSITVDGVVYHYRLMS